MKKLLFIAVAALIAVACNNSENKKDDNKSIANSDSADHEHSSDAPHEHAPQTASIDEVLKHYLELKNSLAADNGNEAATHSKALLEALNNVDTASLSAGQKQLFADAGDDAKEHAEHIGMNADKIAHQREHFDMLSKDLYDLVKVFGTNQTLYKDHCPMYNNNKGADWLSETKEIKNPYLGKKMPTCGTVKETINQ